MFKHFSFICKTSTLYSLFKAILYNTDQYKWQNYHITTVREIEGIIPSSRRGVGILTAGSPTKLTRTDTKDKHRGLQLPPPIQPKGQLLSCWFRHMSNSPKQTLKLVLLKQTGFVVFVLFFFFFYTQRGTSLPFRTQLWMPSMSGAIQNSSYKPGQREQYFLAPVRLISLLFY